MKALWIRVRERALFVQDRRGDRTPKEMAMVLDALIDLDLRVKELELELRADRER